MGRRSNYDKIPRDLYETIDPKAIPKNLITHLKGKTFWEPCVGSGKLVEQLEGIGAKCLGGSDIEPLIDWGVRKDGLSLTEDDLSGIDLLVSNPPYTKEVLLPLIEHWSSLRPTWLLLPATFMHVKYAQPYMEKCSNVVSIGRLYFFKNTWVTRYEFDYEELDKKWDPQVEFFNMMTGVKEYTGYLTPDGKPHKSEFVRGVEDYCFYRFQDTPCNTFFEVSG